MTDDASGRPGLITRLKDGALGRWKALVARYTWLRHVLDAYALMTRNNGNIYAGAITFFSFLALFPLILLAVSVVGFVLSSHPDLQTQLFAKITTKVPGGFGDTLKTSIAAAVTARASIGVIGLVGVLLTGLGWIGNLRAAIAAVWGVPQEKRNFLMSRVANLLVLGGLGIGLIVSLALTAVGTAVSDQVLNAIGLSHVPGFHVLLTVVSYALGIAGDMIIFWWVMIRIPDVHIAKRTAIKGTLLAAVGFEVLKFLGTYTIAKATKSPTAGPFGSVIAILVWIQLVCRYLLFSCAWTAVLDREDDEQARGVVPAGPADAPGSPDAAAGTAGAGAVRRMEVSPAAVGTALVGTGAVAGAVATWATLRRERRPDA